jgi:hypothetical protein
MHEKATNLGQGTTVLVLMVGGMLVWVVMLMIVLMLNRSGSRDGLMQPAIDHDIDLGGLNAAAAYPGDL